jgi:hypothetical protein
VGFPNAQVRLTAAFASGGQQQVLALAGTARRTKQEAPGIRRAGRLANTSCDLR